MTETYLSQAIGASGDLDAAYDTNVKFLLADKQILARILKYAVEEFADMEIPEIMSSIGKDIEVETQRTAPGLSNTGRVQGTNTEDNVLGEGKIFFDIRFSAYHEGEEMKFLINVEAQKSSNPSTLGYHIENRIVYYLSRMVSAQKQTEFYHSDYDNLKKVRSIWICMDTGENNDSIEEIYLDRRTLFGNVPKTYDVDLIRGIIIRIRNRKNAEESKNILIAMLEDLLSEKNEAEKKQTLEEKYGMKMTVELEGRLQTMCNLSENIRAEGITLGMSRGMKRGIEQGLSQGIEQGMKKGIAQGIEQGMSQGLQQGLSQGITEGGAKQIIEMGYDFGLSENDILSRLQDKLNVSLQTAQEYLKMFGKQTV